MTGPERQAALDRARAGDAEARDILDRLKDAPRK
jgi:hypothetical protein